VIDAGITVLIQGETGTGKELVAKVIHYGGRYKDQPFISENCGALTDSLLESELFGHVKGAFTGAISDKKGLFELADGGAVMLDEIGEMPPNMQVKMLRVLQENEFRPVGGSVYKKVNVRIIACTNRNLEEEVEKGKFRQDLYYRINVFPINIPPLRKRREDIPLLANHFLEFFSEKYNRPKPILTTDALDRLMGYDWPGNVRELQNEIERALTLARPDEDISAEHLSTSLRNTVNNGIIDDDLHLTLPETVTRVEKQMISRELEKAKMNRTHAAQTLGISRQGLLKKIKRYNISL
jgi:Nif-specific regulatory protein